MDQIVVMMFQVTEWAEVLYMVLVNAVLIMFTDQIVVMMLPEATEEVELFMVLINAV